MLTFEFTGVDGRMTESETLTSGMVGKTVQILFDESWNRLTKTIVFRCDGICRTADGSLSPVTIPEDVLARPFRNLHVGAYGTDEAGTLVIPTVMAEGPMIRYGADPTEDSTAEDLPVLQRFQAQIGNLADLETDAKENLVAAINEVRSQGGSGLSETAAGLLIEILRHGVFEINQRSNIDTLESALFPAAEDSGSGSDIPAEPDEPEITLTGITVTYFGGDVPVGTSVEDLTDITVTAHYSDGSSTNVSDYIRSGTIAEGSNTVTVAYQGKTAAFSVTGVIQTAPPARSEILEIIYTSSYPDAATFEYTERDSPSQYFLAKQSTLVGGVLSVDYDPTIVNGWNMNILVLDADGNPYLHSDRYSVDMINDLGWGEKQPHWSAIGEGSGGFGTVLAPFTVQIPENCTFMITGRLGSGTKDGVIVTSNATFAEWVKNGGVTFTVTAYL